MISDPFGTTILITTGLTIHQRQAQHCASVHHHKSPRPNTFTKIVSVGYQELIFETIGNLSRDIVNLHQI